MNQTSFIAGTSAKKFTRSSRFLLVDGGYFLVRELANALKKLGHEAIILRLPTTVDNSLTGIQQYGAFLKNLIETARNVHPEALLTVNHIGFDNAGIMTHLLDRMRLPMLVWYIDSPRYIFRNPTDNLSPWVGAFVWDKAYIPWMQETGFEHVHYLPLASDPATFSGPATPSGIKLWRFEGNDNRDPLVFVGDSMAATVRKALQKLPHPLARGFQDGENSITHQLVQGFQERATAPPLGSKPSAWELLSSLSMDLVSSVGFDCEEMKLDFESALSLAATRHIRTNFISQVADSSEASPLVIYGDHGWKQVLRINGVPRPGIQLIPTADYYLELPQIYHDAGAVLNLTGLQMPKGLNQRCYDVPAAGGFLMTDAQEALSEQFLPEEVVSFHSREEMIDQWNYFSQHPEQRREIADKGRLRVMKQHTYEHRLREMLAFARSWFS